MFMPSVLLKHLSALQTTTAPAIHVAIICDGNGRWATSRGLPRSAGHRAGAEAARSTIRSAPHLGIHTLTLFTLSSSNWIRPPAEVEAILKILKDYLLAETEHCLDEGIRLSIIGRRDRFHPTLREAIAESEAITAKGKNLHLRLAVDYSSRHCLFQAASKFYKATNLSTEAFSHVLSEVQRGGSTDVDLLIRTGRGATAFRFPAVGMRLRGIYIPGEALARLHAAGPAQRHGGICEARAHPRRPAPGIRQLARS